MTVENVTSKHMTIDPLLRKLRTCSGGVVETSVVLIKDGLTRISLIEVELRTVWCDALSPQQTPEFVHRTAQGCPTLKESLTTR
jgi:hypothetical protein